MSKSGLNDPISDSKTKSSFYLNNMNLYEFLLHIFVEN
jgi:hypothetical protein